MSTDHPRHGTLTGYRYDLCRCAECCETARLYRLRQRMLRRAKILAGLRRVVHGTAEAYVLDLCRCPACVEAGRAERQAATARLEENPAAITHGTTYAYQRFQCRCTPCRAARNEYDRRRRARVAA